MDGVERGWRGRGGGYTDYSITGMSIAAIIDIFDMRFMWYSTPES